LPQKHGILLIPARSTQNDHAVHEPAITDTLTFSLLTLEGNVSEAAVSCLSGKTSASDLNLSNKKKKTRKEVLIHWNQCVGPSKQKERMTRTSASMAGAYQPVWTVIHQELMW